MSDDTWFGPDRDREPGIRFVPAAQMPPMVTEWMTESTAVHSKSLGWLPAIIIKVATIDGAAIVGTLIVDEQLDDIVDGINTAITRSRLDVIAGIADGTLT